MDWPEQPIEAIAPRSFVPPFCPYEECPSNDPGCDEPFRIHRHGVFARRSDSRFVPRFLCRSCGRTFSQQTFACTYYMKRPELLREIAAGLNAGSAHRQLARSLGCAPSTVTDLASRLGRHALLLQTLCLERIDRIREPLVYDDFESFAFSQNHPFGMGTAVGQRSWLVYGLEYAPHRRGGRRSMRRRRPTGPEHQLAGAYRRAFARLLDLFAPKIDPRRPLEIVTDEHPGYRAGLSGHPARERIHHRSFRNPPRGPKGSPASKEARVRDHQMFAVDLLHKLIRHSAAAHRRETIAFGRRLNALMERGFLLAAWRNFVKARTERRPDPTTPAMWVGLTREPWTWTRLLGQRLFPWCMRVPESWGRVYRRELITTAIGPNRVHALVNAF